MNSGPAESELILREMRKLDAWMHPINPDPVKLQRFRDLFVQLDVLLKTGALLPDSWITRKNYTHLPTETTHTITDFDPPHANSAQAKDFAWCGHRFAYGSTEYCNSSSCGNYLHKHAPEAKA